MKGVGHRSKHRGMSQVQRACNAMVLETVFHSMAQATYSLPSNAIQICNLASCTWLMMMEMGKNKGEVNKIIRKATRPSTKNKRGSISSPSIVVNAGPTPSWKEGEADVDFLSQLHSYTNTRGSSKSSRSSGSGFQPTMPSTSTGIEFQPTMPFTYTGILNDFQFNGSETATHFYPLDGIQSHTIASPTMVDNNGDPQNKGSSRPSSSSQNGFQPSMPSTSTGICNEFQFNGTETATHLHPPGGIHSRSITSPTLADDNEDQQNRVLLNVANRNEVKCLDTWRGKLKSLSILENMKQHKANAELEGIDLTDEQLSVLTFGRKSGYICGLGRGPKPAISASGKRTRAELEQEAYEVTKRADMAERAVAEARKGNAVMNERVKALEAQQADFSAQQGAFSAKLREEMSMQFGLMHQQLLRKYGVSKEN